MSRMDAAFDGEVVAAGLWQSMYQRSTRGKKGQRNLHDFIAALDAMPEKRLIRDAEVEKLYDEEKDEYVVVGVCAVACFAAAKGGDARYFGEEDDSDIFSTAELGKSYGLSWTMAWEMARANDGTFAGLTPQERWQAMRDWAVSLLQPLPALPLGIGA